MTDMSTTAAIASRRSNLHGRSILTLRIGASLAAVSAALGDAFKMAYVEPCTRHGGRPQALPDDDLGGRDPTW